VARKNRFKTGKMLLPYNEIDGKRSKRMHVKLTFLKKKGQG
jgi:hypothetical protein